MTVLFLAALVWSPASAALTAPVGAQQVELRFTAVNSGGAPVQVVEVAPSCRCTHAGLSRREVPPQGTVVLTARVDLGPGDRGTIHKTILVKTGDGAPPQTLNLTITVQPWLVLAKSDLQWTAGQSPQAFTVPIRLASSVPVRCQRVLVSNPAFTAGLVQYASGPALRIAPVTTRNPAQGVVRIEAELNGQVQAFPVYVSVVPE
jgi:hypothetical protein